MTISILTQTHIEAPRVRSNRVANQVPDEILNDPLLNKAIETVSKQEEQTKRKNTNSGC